MGAQQQRSVWWKVWPQMNRVGIFVYRNTFFPFLFCLFFFFSNLQSLSICLCREINLWYALYMWHFVTFFAWHTGGIAMCTAHTFSYYKLLRTREYKELKKGWDVSATKTPRLDLKPLYIKKAPCKQKLKWDPKLQYCRLKNTHSLTDGRHLWTSLSWPAPSLPLSLF